MYKIKLMNVSHFSFMNVNIKYSIGLLSLDRCAVSATEREPTTARTI